VKSRLLACVCATVVALCVLVACLAAAELHYIHFNRDNLPDLGPFTRFEVSTIGRVYDADGRLLVELAREQRDISRYEDIPPVVRGG
jgi:membrane carboxypeptidase/penicillin-binding protein